MGIPGLFAWLIKKYSKILLLNNISNKNDILFIDANCLFHPICNKTKNESEMINNIILYLDNLIKTVNPLLYTYISVDGVPPNAKICQQRKRRFKSVYDEINRNNIKIKHNKEVNNWSSINITPGTLFMEQLHNSIKEHYKNNRKIIYSSFYEEGEGEHKIMNHIRKSNNILENKQIIIYGLDADLIVLSLKLMEYKFKNIYLLRDNIHINYLDVNKLLLKLNEELNTFSLVDNTENKFFYLNDIIFLTYLLGNDFLPRLPTINIKREGGDIILDLYISIYNKYLKKLVNDDYSINEIFLTDIFKSLSKNELEYFKIPDRDQVRYNFNSDYEKDIWIYETTMDNSIDNFILNPLKLDEIKYKYYSYFFKSYEHQEETINDLCRFYIEGLIWILEYYIKGCRNWLWYYPYDHIPFASDIYVFLLNNKTFINKIKHNESHPIDIQKQLKIVIPPQHKNILKKEDQKIYELLEYVEQYPTNYKLDTFDNKYIWQCNPQISVLDIS